MCVDTQDDVVGACADTQKKAAVKGKSKASKPKAKREASVLLEDFAAALDGATSVAKSKRKKASEMAVPEPDVEPSLSYQAANLSAKATLIICPLSVLSNWLDQFEQHVRVGIQFSGHLYYGVERNSSKMFLSSQDVVLTTYKVLSDDYATKGTLHGISWLRVVLDEGHVIRNLNAQMGKALLQLQAQRRWILSGTPIQNGVKDLQMVLAFLRLNPFNINEWWNQVIQRPVTQGDRAGLQNLRTLLKHITMRRTRSSKVNGRPLVSLTEKTVRVEQVELTQKEREEYDLVHEECTSTINRLRKHWCYTDQSSDTKRLMEKLKLVLISGLDERCSVCLNSFHKPVITGCAHLCCRLCIERVISDAQETAHCPLCRSEINTDQLVELPPEELEEDATPGAGGNNSKVGALLGNLRSVWRLRSEDSSLKCLVVSQFTSFLSILETQLSGQGFKFVRLDGTTTQQRRARGVPESRPQESLHHAAVPQSRRGGA